jgi:hypothetical protein
MKHVIKFEEGEVLTLEDSYGRLLITLNEEDISSTEVVINTPKEVQRVIDALQEHKEKIKAKRGKK